MTYRRLSALYVGNFKAFADTQRIPLKPITLIFGPNSAGKSSFIHSLALAHEAQFGRDKRGFARLDVHHTDIGGSSIDLGGFRQFVHRGQANKRVEWGAELDVAALDARLRELLQDVRRVSVSLTLGIELDDQERPKAGAAPRVEAVAIAADGEELLRMSHRRAEAHGNRLRLDRLAVEHPVFRRIVGAIVESSTTAETLHEDDLAGARGVIAELLPKLQVHIAQFFPGAVELPEAENAGPLSGSALFPVSKGNRSEDIAQAVRAFLPRMLDDFVKRLSQALAEDLKRLQYLGPLRSFPPRHIAFAEHEDANWYAGGGYAWDMVRRDETVRDAVNVWLGSDKLKTPYQLVVRKFAALDSIRESLGKALEDQEGERSSPGEDDADGIWIRDPEQDAADAVAQMEAGIDDEIQELSLIDKRSGTRVTHRDVGIGISQVLPVLVMAYGSMDKLLAMEQPEIHLHPALQAELGDVFIEAALGERGNTFILETHSEHLILRLMRRMRETWQKKETGLPAVTPADVSILYVEPDGSRSIVREMPLNEAGELVKAWPGGFFEEGLREQFGDA
jgi:hypothetical protein